jgi:hypothetical protein
MAQETIETTASASADKARGQLHEAERQVSLLKPSWQSSSLLGIGWGLVGILEILDRAHPEPKPWPTTETGPVPSTPPEHRNAYYLARWIHNVLTTPRL